MNLCAFPSSMVLLMLSGLDHSISSLGKFLIAWHIMHYQWSITHAHSNGTISELNVNISPLKSPAPIYAYRFRRCSFYFQYIYNIALWRICNDSNSLTIHASNDIFFVVWKSLIFNGFCRHSGRFSWNIIGQLQRWWRKVNRKSMGDSWRCNTRRWKIVNWNVTTRQALSIAFEHTHTHSYMLCMIHQITLPTHFYFLIFQIVV